MWPLVRSLPVLGTVNETRQQAWSTRARSRLLLAALELSRSEETIASTPAQLHPGEGVACSEPFSLTTSR